jgi:hypothetical protein
MSDNLALDGAPSMGYSLAVDDDFRDALDAGDVDCLMPLSWDDALIGKCLRELTAAEDVLLCGSAETVPLPMPHVLYWCLKVISLETGTTARPRSSWRLFCLVSELQRELEAESLRRARGVESESRLCDLLLRANS